jgi:hypothetical protein
MEPLDAAGSRASGMRLYVVIGDPDQPFDEPSYSTDPRHYSVPIFNNPVTNDEFEAKYRHRVKAFLLRDHAITFAYHCNLDSVQCPVYEWSGGKWVYNEEETVKVADDIN